MSLVSSFIFSIDKTHETELAVLKKTLNQLPHQVTTYSTSPSKNRHELRVIIYLGLSCYVFLFFLILHAVSPAGSR